MKYLKTTILLSVIFFTTNIFGTTYHDLLMVNYNLQGNIGNISFKNYPTSRTDFKKISIAKSYAKTQTVPNVLIHNNIIYTINSNTVLIAVDLSSKKIVKRISLKKYSKSSVSGITYSNNVFYITFFEGEVIALAQSSYNLIWEVKLINPVSSAPLVTDDKLFLVSGSDLFALKTNDGSVIWSVPSSSDGVSFKKIYSASIYLGYVLIGMFSGDVLIVQQDNGMLVAKYNISGLGFAVKEKNPLLGDIKSAVIGYKDNILITANNKTVLYSLTKRQILWQIDVGALHTPSINNNIVYLVSSNSALHAINLDSGKSIWSSQLLSLKRSKSLLFWDVKILNNNLIVSSSYGDVGFYNMNDGKMLENIKQFSIYSSLKEVTTNAPAITSSNMVFLSSKGNLYIY